jgi:hypothetical protein
LQRNLNQVQNESELSTSVTLNSFLLDGRIVITKIVFLVVAAAALIVSWRAPAPPTGDYAHLSLLLISLAPIFVFFGLLSVWLSDYLGSFSGPLSRGGFVDSPTPVVAFVWFGYLLLALPLIAFLCHIIGHGTRTI